MSDTEDNEPKRKRERAKRRERGVFERPKDSGVWWVVYFDEHGRRHREKVGPKGLAGEVYRKRKTEIAERRFFPERIRRRDVLLADMIRDYLDREKGRMRSFVNYQRYGRYWADALPGKALRQIIPGDIERYVARRTREGMAPASVNRELTFLRRLFNVAIADGLVDSNPVRAVKFFKENNQRVRFLSDDEETRLQASVGEEQWPLVAVAIHTGLRQSEEFHLRWEHVDFATGILTVPRSKHGGARRVTMNDTVRETLRALPSRLKSPYVFPSATGKTPLDAKNFLHRVFLPALKAARVEGFRWHDLRHTFASRLVMAGVDLRTVQERMGHKTQAMTLRYSHLSPEHQLDAVQRLNRPPTATATATEEHVEKVASEAGGEVVELPAESSEPCWDRTSDPLLKRQMLYRLS